MPNTQNKTRREKTLICEKKKKKKKKKKKREREGDDNISVNKIS